jgi:putative transposase
MVVPRCDLDLHSRWVIGWTVSNRMKRDLAIRALKMAIAYPSPPKGCIHHTDRGSQYCSHDDQKILRQHGLTASMNGKGNYYEFKDGLRSRSDDPGDHLKPQNTAVKTFFNTIRLELTWRQSRKTLREARYRSLNT